MRDHKLPGAAHRVAVLIWQLQNSKQGYAWPSLFYIASELTMHKSTVIRSLRLLERRGWLTKARRGDRIAATNTGSRVDRWTKVANQPEQRSARGQGVTKV